MTLAIDTAALTQEWVPSQQNYLVDFRGDTTRFQIVRVCVHATVFHDDDSTIERLFAVRNQVVARQAALDWQPDQEDDLGDEEVFHHLKQQAETSPWLIAAMTQSESTQATVTTLAASCAVQSPTLIASTQQRPLSSFDRYFFRDSHLLGYNKNSRPPSLHKYLFSSEKVVPFPPELPWWWPIGSELKIVGGSSSRNKPWFAAWQVQYDFVDLLSRRNTSSWSPQKRGRLSRVNPFHRVPSSSPPVQDTRSGNHLPEEKKFKGVRYRRDRRTWTAEMRPPKSKDKVSFGEFKCQIQAARVIDVAYYYYDKLDFLNFPDIAHILSATPLPAGFGDEDKLRFVKEQAKWVKSIASTLPSGSPASVTSAIPDSPMNNNNKNNKNSSGCKADCTSSSMFLSLSELESFLICGDADEADDGISVQLDSMVSNGLVKPALVHVIADAGGFVTTGTLQEQQGLILQWSLEGGFADPCVSTWWPPDSSLRITDGWDEAEDSSAPALTDFVIPGSQSQSTYIMDHGLSA